MESSNKTQCCLNDADISKILKPFFDDLKNAFIRQVGFYWEIRTNNKDGLYFAVVETIKQERTLKIVASSYFSHEQLFYLNAIQVQHYLQPAQDGKPLLWIEKIHGKTANELTKSLSGQANAVMEVCERFFGAKLFTEQ